MHSHETRQKNDIHIAGTRTTSAKQASDNTYQQL